MLRGLALIAGLYVVAMVGIEEFVRRGYLNRLLDGSEIGF